MTNRVCTMLGCQVPVLEGGLAYVGNGLLAAAVSNGGGFGQIGTGGRSPEDFERQILIALEATDRPFGVNIPISEHRDPGDYFRIVEQYSRQIRAVSLSAGNPRPYIDRLKQLGLVVMTLASTPEQAAKAEASGADMVICEGAEAGGHNGPAELTTLVLVPLAVQAVTIPVIAAGGIGDGRTAAAAFCLGAEGVQVGTRFVATVECQAHERYKDTLVQARADETVVMERSLGRVTRVLKSPFVERILVQEKETPGDLDHLLPMISGSRNKMAAIEGRLEDGWLNTGQSVGLIRSVQPAAEVVKQIMEEARMTVQQRCEWISDPGES